MKKMFLGMLIFAIGCGGSVNEKTIIGKWTNPILEIEYKADGTETTSAMGVVSGDKWEFVKIEGNNLTLHHKSEGTTAKGTPFPVNTITIVFDGCDKMTWHVASNPDAPTFEFVRID